MSKLMPLCLALFSAGLLTVGGCVNAEAPKNVQIGSPPQSTNASPPAGAADSRSAVSLRMENAQLRPRLEQMERDYQSWTAAIDKRQADIKELKHQRDALKKDRDRYKKMLKD